MSRSPRNDTGTTAQGAIIKQGGNADIMRTWMLCILCCGLMLLPGIALASTTPLPLRVAVTTERPPFAFRTETGVLTGFDVAVARALCHALERPCLVAGMPAEAASCSISVFASVFTFATIVVTSDPFISC